MKRILAMALAAVAGCCQVEDCGAAPSIERMPSVKYEPMTPQSCAKPCGEAKVWDFTKGLPAGGALRKGGRHSAEGLYAADANSNAVFQASGFLLNKRWTPSGAFLFEADGYRWVVYWKGDGNAKMSLPVSAGDIALFDEFAGPLGLMPAQVNGYITEKLGSIS